MAIRTGAPHPLPNFCGCGRTRRTRSNGAPELLELLVNIYKRKLSSHVIFNSLHFTKKEIEIVDYKIGVSEFFSSFMSFLLSS